MTKLARKYRNVFPILVLCYVNFYFLSPFIHEHPLVVNDQFETENTLHSHLENIITSYSVETKTLGGGSYTVNTHSHNFAFDKPIFSQQLQKINDIVLCNIYCPEDAYYKAIDEKLEVPHLPEPIQKDLWEKYVHFAANNSPPVTCLS